MSHAAAIAATALTTQRRQVIFAGVSALILTVGIARFAYTPMLPVMKAQAGLDPLTGGWLAAFNYAGYMTGALTAALISDLHRKFILYRWGLIVAALSTAAMALTQDPVVWTLLRFVSGLSSTAGLLIASGLVLNWLIRHHFRPELGLHFTGIGLGIMISGLAVAAMAGLNWDQQWLGLTLVGLAFFLPAWRWLPAPAAYQAGAASPSAPPPPNRWLAPLMAAYFCAGVGFVISATFTVAIVEKLPLLAGHGNWVWVIVGAAALPSPFFWDRVAAAIGQMPALLVAFAAQVVSILLPALSDGAAANLAGAVLYGGTFVGIVSLTLTLIGRRYPANPAKAMARLTLSYGVAQIIAPAAAGYIAAATDSYRGALLMAAAAMIVGMVFLLLTWRAETATVTPSAGPR